MSINTTQFKHVSYLWDEAKAAELAGDEVALIHGFRVTKLAAQGVDVFAGALVGVGDVGVNGFESLFDGFIHGHSQWL